MELLPFIEPTHLEIYDLDYELRCRRANDSILTHPDIEVRQKYLRELQAAEVITQTGSDYIETNVAGEIGYVDHALNEIQHLYQEIRVLNVEERARVLTRLLHLWNRTRRIGGRTRDAVAQIRKIQSRITEAKAAWEQADTQLRQENELSSALQIRNNTVPVTLAATRMSESSNLFDREAGPEVEGASNIERHSRVRSMPRPLGQSPIYPEYINPSRNDEGDEQRRDRQWRNILSSTTQGERVGSPLDINNRTANQPRGRLLHNTPVDQPNVGSNPITESGLQQAAYLNEFEASMINMIKRGIESVRLQITNSTQHPEPNQIQYRQQDFQLDPVGNWGQQRAATREVEYERHALSPDVSPQNEQYGANTQEVPHDPERGTLSRNRPARTVQPPVRRDHSRSRYRSSRVCESTSESSEDSDSDSLTQETRRSYRSNRRAIAPQFWNFAFSGEETKGDNKEVTAQQFLISLEMYKKSEGLTSAEMVHSMHLLFRRTAQTWWSTACKTATTMKIFKKMYREQWLDGHHKTTAYVDLVAYKQNGEAVMSYIINFEAKAELCRPRLEERSRIKLITLNLDPDYRKDVELQRPYNIRDLKEICKSVERCRKMPRGRVFEKFEKPADRSARNAGDRRGSRHIAVVDCLGGDYVTDEEEDAYSPYETCVVSHVNTQEPETPTQKKEFRCFNCKMLGHTWRRCQQKIERPFCMHCGTEGVKMTNCPNKVCQDFYQDRQRKKAERRPFQQRQN